MKLLHWVSSSLRAKLMSMFVVLTCIPLIVVGLISYQKSYKTVYANSQAAAVLQAQQLARDIDNWFADTSKLLELEKHPHVLHYLFSQTDTYGDALEILKTMESYRNTYQYNHILNITMINLYGRGISERKGVFQLERNPLRDPRFAYLVEAPEEVLLFPSTDPSPPIRLDGFNNDEKQVTSILATVKQRITHQVIGFIVIDVDEMQVRSLCEQIPLGDTGFFYLVDSSGQPVITPLKGTGRIHSIDPEQRPSLLAAANYSYVDQLEGKPEFILSAKSAASGWHIVGQVPLHEIVHEAHGIRQLIIISVSLSILFAITLHLYISSRLTKPVQILKNKMRLAASGFLEAKVTPTGQDEIADLGESFNIMLAKLKKQLEQSIREQEEIQKSELRALQAQINPHFLYNTLDSIIWMAEAGRNEQVVQLVQSLSKLFRISLSRGRDWIPVETELEHVRSYLTIQQMRYRDILTYEIDVDKQLLSFSILKMTLQPIVENALYHGLKNKRGLGKITITGRADNGNHMLLTVEDNGKGMNPERLAQVKENLDQEQLPAETGQEVSGGFGLYNVQKRLRLFYGEGYGVKVDSTEAAGTKVEIRIPIQWR